MINKQPHDNLAVSENGVCPQICKTVAYTVDLLCGQIPEMWIPEK